MFPIEARMILRCALSAIAAAVILGGPLPSQAQQRPKILGIAHMALYVSDLNRSREFYKGFLGFEEPFALPFKDRPGDRIAFIKINEEQYIELFVGDPARTGGLNHIAFYTDDAAGMRGYLASKGVAVPSKVGQGQIGNSNFNIVDPEGNTVEIVQYEPDGRTRRERGRFLGPDRVSVAMPHIGVLAGDLAAAQRFYGGILGFREIWRGGGSPKELSWVHMQVPDGDDYLELMLYRQYPERGQMGVKNHICLVTPDIAKAVQTLKSRPAGSRYEREIEIKVGVNRRRQANLFDPDGTRVELMEPHTIDGMPAPSSTAPPPPPSKRGREATK